MKKIYNYNPDSLKAKVIYRVPSEGDQWLPPIVRRIIIKTKNEKQIDQNLFLEIF